METRSLGKYREFINSNLVLIDVRHQHAHRFCSRFDEPSAAACHPRDGLECDILGSFFAKPTFDTRACVGRHIDDKPIHRFALRANSACNKTRPYRCAGRDVICHSFSPRRGLRVESVASSVPMLARIRLPRVHHAKTELSWPRQYPVIFRPYTDIRGSSHDRPLCSGAWRFGAWRRRQRVASVRHSSRHAPYPGG